MSIEITVDRRSKNEGNAHVEVATEIVDKERKKIVKEIGRYVSLPGFRPGKAPVNIIKRKFSKDIENELVERLANQSIEKLQDQEGKIVGQPRLIKHEFSPEDKFIAEVEISFYPEIILPDYKNIPVNLPKEDNSFEDFKEKNIKILQNYAAKFIDLPDRELTNDDFFRVSLHGGVDGKSIDELVPKESIYANQEEVMIAPKKEDIFPELTTLFIGEKPGCEKEFEHKFDEDFRIKELQNKTATYKAKLLKITKVETPPYDEELIAKFFEEETIESYENTLKEQFKRIQENHRNIEIQNQIDDYLVNNSTLETPEDLVNTETQARINRIVQQYRDSGMSEEEIQKSKNKIFEEAKEGAQKAIKLLLVNNEIAKRENLTCNQNEILEEIKTEAMRRGLSQKAMLKEIKKKSTVSYYQHLAIDKKILEFLTNNANIKEDQEVNNPKENKETNSETNT